MNRRNIEIYHILPTLTEIIQLKLLYYCTAINDDDL